jgi:hypothetical protein
MMARKTKKKPKNYPNAILFDENLEGVANLFELAEFNIPDVYVVIKGATNHILASDLNERVVLFTSDSEWLTRQPPYKHGGIVFLDTGNLSMEKKGRIIYGFLYAFHIKNKILDSLRNRRFRLTKTSLWEEPIEGESIRIWSFHK